MCDPVTALIVAGTAVSSYGQIQAGNAAAAQGQYMAAVNRNNAIIAQQNADAARARGSREAARQRLETSKMIGSQRAAFGASGVTLDSGSALDVQMDTAQMGELDAQMIMHNAELEARGFEQQSSNFESQAVMNNLEGKSAKRAGLLGGISTGFSGASSAFKNFNSTKKPKTTTT